MVFLPATGRGDLSDDARMNIPVVKLKAQWSWRVKGHAHATGVQKLQRFVETAPGKLDA